MVEVEEWSMVVDSSHTRNGGEYNLSLNTPNCTRPFHKAQPKARMAREVDVVVGT